jgi:hypothetical protein
VEVTEKNQIRGNAVIRNTAGKRVVRSEVSVHFDMPEIPSEAELRCDFNGLKLTFLTNALNAKDEEGRKAMEEGMALIAGVEHIFEQQPLERQEVFVALRRLRNLLRPPDDQMKPTRAAYSATLAQCRTALDNRVVKARETLAANAPGTLGSDAKLAVNAREVLEKSGQIGKALAKLETEGLAAHARKDRYSWARFYDALTDLEMGLRDRPTPIELPTILHKLLAGARVSQYLQQVDARAEELERAGRLDDWQGEIERIRKAIFGALQCIQSIDDSLPTDQGLAQIRQLFARQVAPLEQAIQHLGVDIGIRAKG